MARVMIECSRVDENGAGGVGCFVGWISDRLDQA